MNPLTESENERIRLIDGIPFVFYKKYENKEELREDAREIKKDYYTRRFRKLQLWVSRCPRWFYKLPALFPNRLPENDEE